MFSKADKTPSSRRTEAKASGTPSIISANLHVVGNLESEGEIQIDGTVDGDVRGRVLTVGASATVNGRIDVDEVVVRGNVNGRIKARVVQLAKTAKVVGDVHHESLAVEAGAYLEGQCQRLDKTEETPEPDIGFADRSTPEEGEEKVLVATPATSGGAG